jgi:PTH1 family peptidyl-tRNA hydrolase
MKLIVGLGNPGNKYSSTRHNAGFIILDYLSDFLKSDFKEGKADFYFAKSKFKGEDIILLKPTTFMNNSGIAVVQFLELYPEIEQKDILVVYDDFQLKLGTIRIRENGSDGGHNGISSIIYNLNSMEIPRMRVGIGKGDVMKKEEFVDFVLTNFDDNEIESIKKLLPIYKDCIISYLSEPFKNVMNKYNKHFLEEEKPETGLTHEANTENLS